MGYFWGIFGVQKCLTFFEVMHFREKGHFRSARSGVYIVEGRCCVGFVGLSHENRNRASKPRTKSRKPTAAADAGTESRMAGILTAGREQKPIDRECVYVRAFLSDEVIGRLRTILSDEG